MKVERIFNVLLALVLLLSVGAQLSQAQAQGAAPMPQQNLPAAAVALTDQIPIQGRLTDTNGIPLNGAYNITFKLYDSDGTEKCSYNNPAEAVANGLFTDYITGCDDNDVEGLELWLGITVGADPEMTPRLRIGAVPYARSLRPGADIKGSFPGGSILNVTNLDTTDESVALRATGGSSGKVYGVRGGVSSPDGYGGYFYNLGIGGVGLYASAGDGNTADLALGSNLNTGTGDNGRISSTAYNSSDLYLTSNDGVYVEVDDNDDEDGEFQVLDSGIPAFWVEESGSAGQRQSADGLVKAAVYASCNDSGAAITRFFNNVNDIAITIADGSSAGRCTIDFGFTINDRYFVATAWTSAARFVSCDWGADSEKLDCFRWDTAGSGADGNIMVLIY